MNFKEYENGICRIAYAVKTNIRTLAPVITSDDAAEVWANGAPGLLAPVYGDKKPNSVKNWIVFGSMIPDLYPMWAYKEPQKLPDKSAVLSLKWNKPPGADVTIFIPENDELFYLRSMECNTILNNGDYVFTTNDLTGSGWQPRVSGVIDVRFELLGDGNLLRVTALTRGKTRYDTMVTRGNPSGWPEEYARAIPDEARHYRLLVSKTSFALKNF
jgi:hypothetical protein